MTGHPEYRHSQAGTPILVGTILALVGATALVAALSKHTLAAAPWLVVALFAVIAAAYALFFRLRVVVDQRAVDAAFGIGVVRKVVPLGDILRADIVRTRLWWGWGIHWTPAGWLYNVGGRRAVRLELRDARPVMIGSDEPEALKAAIDARLRERD
jgi:hypothetical protein